VRDLGRVVDAELKALVPGKEREDQLKELESQVAADKAGPRGPGVLKLYSEFVNVREHVRNQLSFAVPFEQIDKRRSRSDAFAPLGIRKYPEIR
jgi:hypothetical protein